MRARKVGEWQPWPLVARLLDLPYSVCPARLMGAAARGEGEGLMADDTRVYGLGTSVTCRMPFSLYVSARVLCSDGVVRATARLASTADTFFSVPCAVQVRGRTVAGYLTVETAEGWSTDTPDDPATVKFVAYANRRNTGLLPSGTWRRK